MRDSVQKGIWSQQAVTCWHSPFSIRTVYQHVEYKIWIFFFSLSWLLVDCMEWMTLYLLPAVWNTLYKDFFLAKPGNAYLPQETTCSCIIAMKLCSEAHVQFKKTSNFSKVLQNKKWHVVHVPFSVLHFTWESSGSFSWKQGRLSSSKLLHWNSAITAMARHKRSILSRWEIQNWFTLHD